MTDQAEQAVIPEANGPDDEVSGHGYVLDEQIGYLLRKAYQRNAVIFSEKIQDLTPTQFAVMARLTELGSVSQNRLGRTVGLDVATTKGVVDRLGARGLLQSEKDPGDKRRQLISLTEKGDLYFRSNAKLGLEVSAETTAPLTASERRTLSRLLKKIQ
ncbi:MarR family winged helix-turn-helix transcriptional regulator [Labrenzia sp. 011]|uniref:MarR family winged helix-turn-helix transcriptional regulator n=1 Tax=Labrenzia sp. 011 TaxID=2171494 RepID=UPI001FCB076E|nr:MarR family winged helix-turn-helix transcriptional regulator [Labrenzia sp. 011]